MTLAPGLDERRDRRDRGPDPRVVGDLAVRERDVEVDAHEDALAGDVRVADRELVHASCWRQPRSVRRRPAARAAHEAR